MQKCLVIRFGELFLKKNNRRIFVQKLISNIQRSCQIKGLLWVKIQARFDHLLIKWEKEHDQEVIFLISLLENTFGISNFSQGYLLKPDYWELTKICQNLEDYCELNFASFRLETQRIDKFFVPDSLTLNQELGDIIRQKYHLKVDLTKPEKIFSIRIYRNYILFLHQKKKGLEGLPVGSGGKVLLLLSGGIDSPVAAYQLMKKGCEITYCHFYNQTTGQEKIQQIVQKLSPYNNYQNTIYLVDFSSLLPEISHISQARYRLVILKRMFLRWADILVEKEKLQALATGDSLAQVSSQTAESLKVIYSVSKSLVLWPLIASDKQSIIQQAQLIGTYDFSLLSYEDCCFLFKPRYPIIKPKLELVEELEKEIFWEPLLEIVVKNKVKKVF